MDFTQLTKYDLRQQDSLSSMCTTFKRLWIINNRIPVKMIMNIIFS